MTNCPAGEYEVGSNEDDSSFSHVDRMCQPRGKSAAYCTHQGGTIYIKNKYFGQCWGWETFSPGQAWKVKNIK